MDPISVQTALLENENAALEEELEVKRNKHLFVQWLVSGNRRAVPEELRAYVRRRPEEARALYKHFRERARRRVKGKKHLFAD